MIISIYNRKINSLIILGIKNIPIKLYIVITNILNNTFTIILEYKLYILVLFLFFKEDIKLIINL